MSRSPLAVALLLLWTASLAASAWYVQRTLVVGADLRLFLPDPQTPQQKLLLEEIGEGPASRVLVAAIEGAAPQDLADTSRALVEVLGNDEHFRFVTNGELSPDSVPEALLPYRYLLSTTLDRRSFDAEYLHGELLARARDLASPAGAFLEPLLPSDPTLELLKVLQTWQPAREPNRLYDVWFDRAGERALLLIETAAPAFDPDRQRAAIDVIERAFATARTDDAARLTVSGPGAFSVLMEERTRTEAQKLGAAATVGMTALLVLAYRSVGSVVLSALPLLSAGVAGLVAVSALFGTVHGITLAFGFTLLGVAQDYPVHLMSHRREGHAPIATVRELWPTLVTGIASTCIAYATFFFSGVTGLAQLACFTVAGLAVAGLTTRFVLPRLLNPSGRDHGRGAFVGKVWLLLKGLPRPRWLIPALALGGALALTVGATPFWENDLGKLTPVPETLLAQDQELRSQLGTADIRYLLAIEAPSRDAALSRLEAIEPQLQALVGARAIEGYDHAARYLPSIARQLERRNKLPDEAELRATLDEALADTPFRSGVFEPFVMDLEQARIAQPLTPESLADSPLAATLDSLLLDRGGGTTALVTFAGVAQPQALQQLATAQADAFLLDLKLASESLVAEQREHLLWSLAAAALLLIAVVGFALRDWKRIGRVLTPMAATTILVVAILHACAVPLTLFHLVALILAAGLGLDYALFFEHAADDELTQRRTLHAVMICAASTLLVFALLATSSMPVLRAIGLTVTLGVVSNFVLAALGMGAGHAARGAGQNEAIPNQQNSPSGQRPAPSAQQPQSPQSVPPLSSLLPHQGAMCLLDRIVEWDDRHVVLEATSHRSPTNPLRMNGRLRAIHLCEYGAQAMAVHGGLQSRGRGASATPGMLVSLRAVSFAREYIDDLRHALQIEAQCLQSSASSLQYEFRVTHENELVAEGRATVVLKT